LDIDHPDIIPFLEMRKETGDHNIRCLNLHHGINFSDKFMQLIEKCGQSNVDDSWPLIDPHTKIVKKIVSARQLWQLYLTTRLRTGEPYQCMIDTCNKMMPSFQKEKGLSIKQSNLCSEIILPTDENRTAVCCLSSLNIEKYDEWKDDKQFIHDTAEMLDNCLKMFIQIAPDGLKRAKFSAQQENSIGIGALGWHAYLQKHMIPIESKEARDLNVEIFSYIKSKVDEANFKLGSERGSPPDAIGTGRRFSCTMAIAPNATTSIIMGNTSPSIEPFRANAYRQDTISGSNLNKNKYLNTLLSSKPNIDLDKIWIEILTNGGSVQNLDCLSDFEKSVFKTAFEIDQNVLLQLASDRQKFIDQSQSLNLFLNPGISKKLLHDLHLKAWKIGLKTLYYCRSTKLTSADTLSSEKPKICKRGQECVACE
jgi:ribonucleoside-diphosphate reductase alpha chain